MLRQLYESASLPPIEQRVVRTPLRTAANNRGELQPADVSKASAARTARQLRSESQNQDRIKRSNVRAENAVFNKSNESLTYPAINKKQLYETLIRIQPKLLDDRYLIKNGGKIKTLSRDQAIGMITRLREELQNTGVLTDEVFTYTAANILLYGDNTLLCSDYSDPEWEEQITLNKTTITRAQARTGGNCRRNQGGFLAVHPQFGGRGVDVSTRGCRMLESDLEIKLHGKLSHKGVRTK